jgi:hypothetical protein
LELLDSRKGIVVINARQRTAVSSRLSEKALKLFDVASF